MAEPEALADESFDSSASILLTELPFSNQLEMPRRKRDVKKMDKDLVNSIEFQQVGFSDETLQAGIMLNHESFKPLPVKSQCEEDHNQSVSVNGSTALVGTSSNAMLVKCKDKEDSS